MKRELISFVIPCYNSEKTLQSVIEELADVMKDSMSDYDYEVIMVNDGSKDHKDLFFI